MTWSCGAIDGGSRGSGITSTIQGNVQLVENTSDQQIALEGIRVRVEDHSPKSITNPAGEFQVQGQFSGHLTVLFIRKSDRTRASLPIYLPSGGTLTLNGVTIDVPAGTAVADSADVDFVGEITQVDCAGQTLTMLSANRPPGNTDMYLVRLDTSSLVDTQGNPVACLALRNGVDAHVQGMVESDGSYGNATVTVE
jgi:hypothetical protein